MELVTEYLDDALTERERAGFEAHLADCRDCVVYLDQMRRTIAALGALRRERASPVAREALLAAFRSWV